MGRPGNRAKLRLALSPTSLTVWPENKAKLRYVISYMRMKTNLPRWSHSSGCPVASSIARLSLEIQLEDGYLMLLVTAYLKERIEI